MVRKWEIFYVNLDPSQGSEQKGSRPVLVISNDAVNANLPVFTCIPFSSVKPQAKVYPTEVFLTSSDSGLKKDSVLMLQQIRTLSLDRVIEGKAGEIVDDEVKNKVNQALLMYFELD